MNTNLKITQVGPLALYIELNGHVYYIDDATDEKIIKTYPSPMFTGSEKIPVDICCVCKKAQGDIDELLVEGWVTFCNPCLDEIARLEGEA